MQEANPFVSVESDLHQLTMPLRKTSVRLTNLRRSGRAEILRQRAQVQKSEALQPQLPVYDIKQDKQSYSVKKKKSLKKKKKSKRSDRRKTDVPVLPVFNGADNDDGFIPEESAGENLVSTQPKQFDELEVWKQYQNFGDNDDGFIPDDGITDIADQGQKLQKKALKSVRLQKRKLSDIWKKDNTGKKLSKKKRRKAERKWLKKLFHESVIIAEPQDNEPSDQLSVPVNTVEVPVEITGKTLLPTENENEDGSNQNQITIDQEMLNDPEMTFAVPPDARDKNGDDVIAKDKPNGHEYASYIHTNGNPPTSLYPWMNQDGHSQQGVTEVDPNRPAEDGSFEESDYGKPPLREFLDGSEELETLRLSGGFSQSEFTQHLIKLYKSHRQQDSSESPGGNNTPADKLNREPEVLTNFVDLTSGKIGSDDKKKRYKMELSLPEKTTILVTNMVERESSLPKVIFMLKKGPSNGVGPQESPLLMGCSGDSKRQGSLLENDTVLIREVQEITQHILRMQQCDTSSTPTKTTEEPRAIPKALEYSME
ncbi:uncharacterized protein [Apostichopus japonicus]|uniref:uncharacterized protein isoform X2 n=1 Tax=Stichopus japonicus TaxID=307972 RepID=UPI003AB42894